MTDLLAPEARTYPREVPNYAYARCADTAYRVTVTPAGGRTAVASVRGYWAAVSAIAKHMVAGLDTDEVQHLACWGGQFNRERRGSLGVGVRKRLNASPFTLRGALQTNPHNLARGGPYRGGAGKKCNSGGSQHKDGGGDEYSRPVGDPLPSSVHRSPQS